jgi:hypothetical protein
MRDPNLLLLENAARLLRPVLDELVFVGGSIAGLLITDPGSAGVRPTLDVDAISDVARSELVQEVQALVPASTRVLRATVAELEDGYADTSRKSGLFAARRSNVQVDSAPSLRPDSPIT